MGLKYISAGDRSMELPQGVLVLCAWRIAYSNPQSCLLMLVVHVPIPLEDENVKSRPVYEDSCRYYTRPGAR